MIVFSAREGLVLVRSMVGVFVVEFAGVVSKADLLGVVPFGRVFLESVPLVELAKGFLSLVLLGRRVRPRGGNSSRLSRVKLSLVVLEMSVELVETGMVELKEATEGGSWRGSGGIDVDGIEVLWCIWFVVVGDVVVPTSWSR